MFLHPFMANCGCINDARAGAPCATVIETDKKQPTRRTHSSINLMKRMQMYISAFVRTHSFSCFMHLTPGDIIPVLGIRWDTETRLNTWRTNKSPGHSITDLIWHLWPMTLTLVHVNTLSTKENLWWSWGWLESQWLVLHTEEDDRGLIT